MFETVLASIALNLAISATYNAILLLRRRTQIPQSHREEWLKHIKATQNEVFVTQKLLEAIEKKKKKRVSELSEREVETTLSALYGLIAERSAKENKVTPKKARRILRELAALGP